MAAGHFSVSGHGLAHQRSILGREDGSQIEDDSIVFDSTDDRYCPATEAVEKGLTSGYGQAVAGERFSRSGPAAEGCPGGQAACGYAPVSELATDFLRPPTEAVDRGIEQGIQRDLVETTGLVGSQRAIHMTESGFVRTQGAIQGMGAERLDNLTAADDDAGLRPTEQLVAGEADDIGPSRQDLGDRVLVGKTPTTQVVQASRTLIDDERQVVVVGQIGEGLECRRGGKPDDSEIGLMRHQQGGCLVTDRPLVIRAVRPVRTAHLDEVASSSSHHRGQSEGTTDLDELGSRDDDLATRSERREDEQQRGGIVVDHHCGLGAADLGDAPSQGRQTLTSTATLDVVLEREVARELLGLNRWHRRSPEVGMEEDPGGVDDRSVGGTFGLLEPGEDLILEPIDFFGQEISGLAESPGFVEDLAARRREGLVAPAASGRIKAIGLGQPMDGRQAAEQLVHGQHCTVPV